MPPAEAVSTMNPNASDYGAVMMMDDNGTVRPRRDDEKSVAGEDDDGVRTYFVICPATAVRFPPRAPWLLDLRSAHCRLLAQVSVRAGDKVNMRALKRGDFKSSPRTYSG